VRLSLTLTSGRVLPSEQFDSRLAALAGLDEHVLAMAYCMPAHFCDADLAIIIDDRTRAHARSALLSAQRGAPASSPRAGAAGGGAAGGRRGEASGSRPSSLRPPPPPLPPRLGGPWAAPDTASPRPLVRRSHKKRVPSAPLAEDAAFSADSSSPASSRSS
jgi:hypothetical protein